MEAFFIQERDIGYLEDYPDSVTQGETEEELLENLRDLYREISRCAWRVAVDRAGSPPPS